MKIKTANVGGIDVIRHVVPVEINTEPIEGYSNRVSGKWYKTHHGDEDIIWLDGSYRIYNKGFENKVIELLGDNDFMVTRHRDRKTLKEEYDFILNRLKAKGHTYLKVRYGNEDWATEMEAFKDGMGAELVHPAFFTARKSTKDFMSEWWELILKYTIFDQSQLTYMLYKQNKLKVKIIDWKELYPYIKEVGHIKLI